MADNSVVKVMHCPDEISTISERYSVEDDGIYHIHEEVRKVGNLASKRLVMPKATFIEAFHKYLGGTL